MGKRPRIVTPVQPAQRGVCWACRPTGIQWTAEAHFAGAGEQQADLHRFITVDLDDQPPPTGRDWLEEAAARLASPTTGPERVTDAARLLEKEMHEAFLRRRVDEAWGAGGIKNFLTEKKFWPSKRRPKT